MPGPITLYGTAKALQAIWKDSKKAREWLWGKVPIIKDLKKREVVEGLIARLLDDGSKLAQALPSEALEKALTDRLQLFKEDLAKEGITGKEAEMVAERASLLVGQYVTGPLGNLIDLRFRLDEDEEALRAAEVTIEALVRRVGQLESESEAMRRHVQRLHLFLAATGGAAVFGLLVALVALAAHR